MPIEWKADQLQSNVVRVTQEVKATTGWESWFLLSSDRHHDNSHTKHKLEKRHLDTALERGAGIIDAGDLHCAMQGKWDPRQDRSALREEYTAGDYLDALVRYAVKFYSPYGDNWLVMGRGNHEQSIKKRHETDLVVRTVDGMKAKCPDSPITAGGYGGWIIFRFVRHGSATTVRLKYYHGAGGGGPVTRGVIQTNRMAVYLPSADIILTGHTHDMWQVPISRERISARGKSFISDPAHTKTSTVTDQRDGTWKR